MKIVAVCITSHLILLNGKASILAIQVFCIGVFIPALIALLEVKEKAIGRELLQHEVEAIRFMPNIFRINILIASAFSHVYGNLSR